MDGAPSVSIVLPAYNAAAFIEESIVSVLNQTFTDFELIIINDGSSDDTPIRISTFTDPRIRFINHESNLGLIATLNEGLHLAKGEFIARMDADDICEPERLSKQVTFLKTHSDTGICGTAMKMFGARKGISEVETESEYLRSDIIFRIPFNHPTVMFRKSLIDNFNLQYDPGFPHAEDMELWTRMCQVTGFGNINEPLVHYRVHEAQVTSRHDEILQTSVRKALANALNRFVDFTQIELELHLKLYKHMVSPADCDIHAVQLWLEKLIARNDNVLHFERDSFRKCCGKMWFLVCTTQAGYGIPAQKIYEKSALAEYYKPDAASRLLFTLKRLKRK